MTEDIALKKIIIDSLYLLALINPISKVSILAILSSEEQHQRLKPLILKSSITAALILLSTMFFGDFILNKIFHVQIHSLRIAGGFVLFWVGFNALRKGIFFEHDTKDSFDNIAIVPLACPMIAGPATIAACVGIRSSAGAFSSTISILVAILFNHLFMLMAKPTSAILSKYNVLGAIIRITGIIVMSIGAQMILDGIRTWLTTIR